MLEEAKWIYSNLEDRNRQGENQLIPFINYQKPAPERCLDMLLSKYRGEHYQTEVVMAKPQKSRLPVLRKKLSQASVMLITDGGLVPYRNPDRVPSVNAGGFYEYPIRGCATLERDKYEVTHQGYDNSFVKEDPNRLVPVDVMRDLEREGIIGKLYDSFLTTVGVMVSTGKSVSLGREIAALCQNPGCRRSDHHLGVRDQHKVRSQYPGMELEKVGPCGTDYKPDKNRNGYWRTPGS